MHSNAQRFSATIAQLNGNLRTNHNYNNSNQTRSIKQKQNQKKRPHTHKICSLGSIFYRFIVRKLIHMHCLQIVTASIFRVLFSSILFGWFFPSHFACPIHDADVHILLRTHRKQPNSGGKSLSNMRLNIKGKKYLILMFQLSLSVAFAPPRYVQTFPSIARLTKNI